MLREAFASSMLFIPDMKTKQIPDNFHDWIKSQTFAICAKMASPLQLPLGNSKRPVKVEMYWIGRKRKGFRPFLASTFTGSLNLRQDGVRVFVPAPVVGESLLRVPPDEHEQAIATFARYFRVLPFDLAAAREFARIWNQREPHIRAEDLREGIEPKKRIYRFDCQIVAIAVSRKMECIYSHDADVRRFAGGEIDVRTIPRPPDEQVPLL